MCEDNKINAEIGKTLLEKRGCIVDWAHNGQEGIERFGSSGSGYYGAILMDVRMPIMDGIEAAKKIRSMDRPDARKVVMIAMSANAFEEDIRKSLDAGMNAHLAKPVEPDAMYAALARQLMERAEEGSTK